MIRGSQHPSTHRVDAAQLASLRAEFPDWGFLVTRRWWIAVRGTQTEIRASSAEVLRSYLHALSQ